MKTIIVFVVMCISQVTIAQNTCSSFYPSQKGKTYVIHHLDKKDRINTVAEYRIVDVTAQGIKVKTEVKEDNGSTNLVTGVFDVKCDGENTWIEPEALVSPGMIQQYQNMDYEISGDGLSIPNSLSVGQQLPDGEILMSVDAGLMKMTITIHMINREVVREEQVTTSAGTFDCYVINYTNTIQMGVKKTFNCTQWIARGVGMVKEESYKQNGKRMTKSVLHQIK